MSGFEEAVRASLPRLNWLLREALAGRPARDCVLPDCRVAAWKHIYAPDCGPR